MRLDGKFNCPICFVLICQCSINKKVKGMLFMGTKIKKRVMNVSSLKATPI